jgi:hypothetical protein
MVSWQSRTNQFDADEMASIEEMSAEQLAVALPNSDPVVVLRVLAEILLNRDTAKLDELLRKSAVNARWQQFESDRGVDDHDRDYASQLRERLPQS